MPRQEIFSAFSQARDALSGGRMYFPFLFKERGYFLGIDPEVNLDSLTLSELLELEYWPIGGEEKGVYFSESKLRPGPIDFGTNRSDSINRPDPLVP
jgi:hypothetical protein